MTSTRRGFCSAGIGAFGGLAARSLSASPSLAGVDGVLDAFLEMRPGSAVLGGQPTAIWGYNGQMPGPALEVHPGDTLRVRLQNSLPEATNLHFHGLHVPPGGNADNSFLEVPSRERFDYEMQIPKDHPCGTFWYHPHMHGSVARQVFRGLSGLIIVRGDLDAIPEVAAAAEQVAILKDISVDRSGQIPEAALFERLSGREGLILTVNGEVTPTFPIQRNGLLRLRFLNASCSRYYRLKIEDHPMAVIALDGGGLRAPVWVDEWLLAPGQRMEALVMGDRPAASYRILDLPYNRGSMGMMGANVSQTPRTLATLSYSGSAESVMPVPEQLLTVDPLPAPALLRRFVLTEGMMMGSFQINGRSFQPNRIDTVVRLNSIEDWEIENRGLMDHPFHVHTNPFQLVGSDGTAEPAWRDVINIPRGTLRRIRLHFQDFSGRTVYHCHILDHEDLGMMGTLEIQP